MAAHAGLNHTLVSVVVPVFNGQRYLDECLESLRAQDHSPLEIIVVDDGSTDGSAAVAEQHAGVRVLRREHHGLAATRNAGIAAATGPLVGFCDADDTWTSHKASRQVAHLQTDTSCDIALCRMDSVFEAGVERPAWLRPDQVRGDLDGVGPTSGLFRRSVFERVGGYRTELGAGSDFDLLIRARTAGCGITVLDEVLMTRRIHDANDMTVNGEPGTGPMLRSVREHLRQRQRDR